MKKNVAGVFASSFGAIQEIRSMMHNGIEKNHIYMMTMDDMKAKEVKKSTGIAHVNSLNKDSLFGPDWTKDETDHYSRELRLGRILIFVDEDHDIGRTDTLTTENMPNKNTEMKVDGGQPESEFQAGNPQDRTRSIPGRPVEKSGEDIQVHRLRKEYEEETDPFEKRGL